MRAIDAPSENPCEVFQVCVNSIADENLRNRLNALTDDIGLASGDYWQRATAKELYTLKPNICGNDDIALGDVTKNELKNLYSHHMVGANKPARNVYDLLKSRAPLGRCPFCGIGQVSTLDHFLPKTFYPHLSVMPINLVPSCKDCNTGKNNAVANTADIQTLHPYFDHQKFINEQWLFAEVIQSSPATICFCVKAPHTWDDIAKARVNAHFNGFNLAGRYSIEAGNEISCLRDTLSQYRDVFGIEGVKQHLMFTASSYSRQHLNSWQTAMYQTLANSDWYCSDGFM